MKQISASSRLCSVAKRVSLGTFRDERRCAVASLDVEIRVLIEGYFALQGETVRACRSRGRKDNLSTWEVETFDDDAELLVAAE